MKIKYLKLKNWLLVSLGGLLGLQVGCDKVPISPAAAEYGCPEGRYHVMGTVVDENGAPIAGIGVGRLYLRHEDGKPVYESLDTTDADGRYNVRVFGLPDIEAEVPFDDIDGEQNGHFRDTVVTVTASRDAFHGASGHWYYGEADVTKNVTLQRIEE